MERFNASISFDQRLHVHDLTGSKAYAHGLYKSGLLTKEEYERLNQGLNAVLKEWETKEFKILDSDEDIHSANERRLSELIGPLAGKLHTGRSRNDQVATDMRLWLKEEGLKLLVFLKDLIQVTVSRASQELGVVMPGYTHLQVYFRYF